MDMKGYANPINYIAKYISKSLDLDGIPDIESCKRVSDLPKEHRTKVWTILNNLVWNSQTWILSKSFKEDLKKLEERRPELPSPWVWAGIVHISDPALYRWMGWDPESFLPGTIPTSGV